MSANHFETVYPSTDQPHSRHENGMSSSYHNPAISSKDKPVQRLIVSTEIDIAFILRTTSNVPSTRPSARPSARPFCFAKSNVANWSRYTLMLSSYFIRSSFDKDAMSTICSNFSNTDLRALKGNLCNVYIFFNTYIQRSKSFSHSDSSFLKQGNCRNTKRSLSENGTCVSRSDSTTSVRKLPSESFISKLRKKYRKRLSN